MIVLNQEIRQLREFVGSDHPIINLYLSVNPIRFKEKEWKIKLKDLVKATKEQLRIEAKYPRNEIKRIYADLDYMERELNSMDLSGVQSVVWFYSSANDLDVLFKIPEELPRNDFIIVSDLPNYLLLDEVMSNFKRYLLILFDKERVRFLEYFMKKIREHLNIRERIHKLEDYNDYGAVENRIKRHVMFHVYKHFKNIMTIARQIIEEEDIDAVIIASYQELLPMFKEHLDYEIKSRLIREITSIDINASRDEILKKLIEIETEIKKEEEEELLNKLEEELGNNGKAVAGIKETLKALYEGKVDTLLISPYFEKSGVSCPSCYYIDIEGETCPYCGSPMEKEKNILPRIYDLAIINNSRVKHFNFLADRLKEKGELAAILRFK